MARRPARGPRGIWIAAVIAGLLWLPATSAGAEPCPCSIWDPATAVPGTIDNGVDFSANELGVKFRSDVNGFVTGVRFYRAPLNGGTHTGSLWLAGTGQELATATFTGESASGWQEVSFAQPVPIIAGTTYIASYFAPQGHYSFDAQYFANAGVDNAPLHALQNGVEGGNGVYFPGAHGFPNLTFSSANYWVDVVVVTEVGPDNTPPTVTSTTPTSGATGVSVGSNVTAVFSEAMDAATVNGSTIKLRDASNAEVPATMTYGAASRTGTLDPNDPLGHSATYTATVTGGPGGVTDQAGNPLEADHTWSFTTADPPPPPPDEGPGGPVLVVATSTNPFGRYYAEILRNEGLNYFTVTDISSVTVTTLTAYDVVVLAEMPLTSGQVTMFDQWVTGGGNLIAMRPDAQLAGLLGLTDTPGTLANAYLRVETASGPGAGIVGETIQFHGTADRYTPNGATTVATLFSDAVTATSDPAVTLRAVGSNGGQAAAFVFELARSVVYTRQGNPAWAGQERDGVSPMRSDDLFFGNASSDPQPDWVNLNKVAIPQADEQQRLLANLILQMNADRKPLPRFWYFPGGEKAVVVMTGDDHGSGGTAGRFDQYVADSPDGCVVADWECVRSSSYIYTSTPLTNAQAAGYHADGFEVGLHFDTGCANWTPTSLDSTYDSQLTNWTAKYTSIPTPSSNRTHCIAWSDWATQPKVELDHGIRLDTNYYYWPPSWVQNRPGFFTGSGMPMRFADLDGTMIDVYQAVTQMTDESGQSYPFTIDTLLDRALGALGYYGAFTANMHTDSASSSGSDAIVTSALARGVPIVSGRQMLEWLDGRNASSFGLLAWDGDTLSFSIETGSGADGLRAMVPTTSSAGSLSGITRNGTAVSFTTETIKGVQYAFFTGTAGNYAAQYGGGGGEADVFVTVSDTRFRPRTATAQQGDTVQWDFTGGTHSATDPSGMGLFDSGPRTAGESYQFTFTTAGRYSVDDTFSTNAGIVSVPLQVAPASGTTATTFTVTWGSVPLSGGFQADVQVRRPGSTRWSNWMVNQTTATSAGFTPDVGAGTYQFRARLENSGGVSRWSTIVSIIVS